jgi:hypothetical protein
VPPRPEGMMRRRGRPRRRAAKQRGPRPEGSSVVTAPSWGSRPPSARRRRRRRDRAELHHLRRNASSRRGGRRRRGGLLWSSRFLRRHRRRGAQRRLYHRPSQGHKPRPHRQERQRPGTSTKSPGGPRREKRSPPPNCPWWLGVV